MHASEELVMFFFVSSRRRHTRFDCDWSSDVCSSDLAPSSPGCRSAWSRPGCSRDGPWRSTRRRSRPTPRCSIVRRDTGESYQDFLTRLAAESGIKTPTREALARLDRRRKKRTSNKDWENPADPDAKITKMKDGRTHLAHKAEHAVDLDTSALVAVTLHGADVGDTTSLVETAIAAAEQIEAAHAARPTPAVLTEIVADKGYHSNQTMIDLEAVAVRSYIAEPERGRRDWTKTPEAQAPVYANRRRVRGARGKRIMRRRGEYVERSFAHMYDTGGLRRTHLRGHHNILKRLLVHAGAFNLGLLMRKAFGRGTPRGLQGRRFGPGALEIAFGMFMAHVWTITTRLRTASRRMPCVLRSHSAVVLAC